MPEQLQAAPLDKEKARVRTYAKDEILSANGLESVQDDMDLITAKAKEWKMDTTHLHHAFRKVAFEMELKRLNDLGAQIVATTDAISYEIQPGPDGKRQIVVS